MGTRTAGELVGVSVELFGTARLACGRRRLDVRVWADATAADVARAAAVACPELVGVAIREDRGGLLASYALNVNGTAFVEDGEDALELREGDRLLLFSSQAGG